MVFLVLFEQTIKHERSRAYCATMKCSVITRMTASTGSKWTTNACNGLRFSQHSIWAQEGDVSFFLGCRQHSRSLTFQFTRILWLHHQIPVSITGLKGQMCGSPRLDTSNGTLLQRCDNQMDGASGSRSPSFSSLTRTWGG